MNLRNIRLRIFKSLMVAGFCTFVGTAHATKYIDVSAESVACGTTYATQGNRTIDGTSVGTGTAGVDTLAALQVLCSPLTAPHGSKYFEHDVPTSINGTTPGGIGPDFYPAGGDVPIVEGTTYYLAAYYRFERIGGLDIWTDWAFDFDKLIEMTGTGWRWIILDGWNGDTQGAAHKFVFTVYDSLNYIPDGSCVAGEWEYYSHNYNGYSKATPLYSGYEQWIPVVLGVRASRGNGHVSLWVSGTQVINLFCTNTMAVGASINRLTNAGTVGQPAYDAPHHKRQLDRVMLTDSWSDIVAGGYASGGDTTPPAAPTGLGVQ
jgi:hypothetical protein